MAARLSGLLLFALIALTLACADEEGSETGGTPVGPELAASISCKRPNSLPEYPGEPNPTVAQELCAAADSSYISPSDVQAALAKLAKAIQDTDGQGEALFASFTKSKWTGPAESLDHLLDHLVLASTGMVGTANVVEAAGDTECTPDGQACGSFPPGWSTQDRLWVSTVVSCASIDGATSLDVFAQCVHHETIPNDPFLQPVTLVQCYDGPASLASIAFAKLQDAFDDPDGTNFEGIEYFTVLSALPPGTPIPACTSSSLARAPGPAAAGSGPAALAGQKGGGEAGIALQGGVGTRLNAFSDWAFVDTLSASVAGTVSNSGDSSPISGATVDLICESESSPRLTTTSAGDGTYSFDNDTLHVFLPGETCEVKGSAAGFTNGSSGTFTVAKGLDDDVDVALDPPTSISGIIESSGGGAVSGATVDLFCNADVTPRQTTTSAVTTGSYSFSGSGTGGFATGDTCEVVASEASFASGSSGTFTVAAGANVKNVTLGGFVTTSNTIRGAVRHTPSGCGPVQCSSTLVGGADVTLACQQTTGAHPSSFTSTTTTGSKGGSNKYGRYTFNKAPPGFGPGWQCTVSATFDTGSGIESGSAGPFAVASGTNVVDFQIE